jgi:hypothetical protein
MAQVHAYASLEILLVPEKKRPLQKKKFDRKI